MTVKCARFGIKIDDNDYPCSMCDCHSNDAECENCSWEGCTHPECPATGCIDRSEDKCCHPDNEGAECPDNCPIDKP